MIPLIYFSSSLSVVDVSVVALERSRIGSRDCLFGKSLCFGVVSRLADLSGLIEDRLGGYLVGVLIACRNWLPSGDTPPGWLL